MDQSRRAVESYWRSRMIDAATSDEDKVTPVYRLEEICDLLRSSHVSIVKEVSQFILKRLEHKSPIVKQKALRIIKYAVGKSGPEFKREMQRNSVAVRQLIHYKGQPDPLKGEALNKAVRETAQEALSVLFSSDDSKIAPMESNLRGRIQGFGNTSYEMPSEDKKSFINEVVDIGSATIKQGLSSLTQSPSLRKSNDSGGYRSPNLQRSLTRESDHFDRYEGSGSHADTYNSSRFSQNAGSGSWGENVTASQAETSNGDSGLTYSQKTREEKLLETIVTSGGVRLQPTRDALNVFMVEASKLDALSLVHAIETKLRAPMWQVRMRAICVLEALLRKKEDRHFSVIASYFGDNKDVVLQCSESPQASLREKATKVLSLLGGEQINGVNHVEKSTKISQPSVMSDLIDTGEPSDLLGMEDSEKTDTKPGNTNAAPSTALIDDLLGNNFGVSEGNKGQKLDEDPFADVSFLVSQDKDQGADLFSGIVVGNSGATEAHAASQKPESEQFDLFSLNSEVFHESLGNDAANLMDGLSINRNDSFIKKNGSHEKDNKTVDSVSNNYPNNKNPSDVLNTVSSQAAGINANTMLPLGAMAYNFPSGLMFNPAFASQPMNYSAMGNLVAQQQFLAAMSNFHQQGGLQSNTSMYAAKGESSSPLPDIFNPGLATQPPNSMMNGSKKEEIKAFDFISDHLASARGPKRVI